MCITTVLRCGGVKPQAAEVPAVAVGATVIWTSLHTACTIQLRTNELRSHDAA